MVCCTLVFPTTYGQSTRSPVTRSGTTLTHPITGCISATAASRCTRIGCISWSPDGHLVSLDAKDGSVRWIVAVADSTKGYWTSMAPLVVGNHVLVGTSGDFDNLVGYVRSVDPETGTTQWQWDATRLGHNGSNHRRQYLDDRYLRS